VTDFPAPTYQQHGGVAGSRVRPLEKVGCRPGYCRSFVDRFGGGQVPGEGALTGSMFRQVTMFGRRACGVRSGPVQPGQVWRTDSWRCWQVTFEVLRPRSSS